MRSVRIILAWLGLLTSAAYSQPAGLAPVQAASSSENALKTLFPEAQLTLDPKTGNVLRATSLSSGKGVLADPDPRKVATRALGLLVVKEALGVSDRPGADQSVEVMGDTPDPFDPTRKIVTLQQKINGLPVYGGTARVIVSATAPASAPLVHAKSYVLDSMTSNFFASAQIIPPAQQVTQSSANAVASEAYTSSVQTDKRLGGESKLYPDAVKSVSSSLFMFDPHSLGADDTGGLRPTWVVKIGSMVYFVDATSAKLLHQYRDLAFVTGFQVNDWKSGSVAHIVYSDPAPGATHAAVAASGPVANLLKSRAFLSGQLKFAFLGRSACAGFPEPAKVSVNVDYDLSMNGQLSFYQSGPAPAVYLAPGTADAQDVVTHELTHGVTYGMTCIAPVYYSGAVSEFLSDFLAIVQKQQDKNDPSLWTIGESLSGYQPPNFPLRDFRSPHLDGFDKTAEHGAGNNGQPENWGEHVTSSDVVCFFDSLASCAHLNSGILSKAAYLAASGGQYTGQTIVPIGLKKLTTIVVGSVPYFQGTVCLQNYITAAMDSCSSASSSPSTGISSTDCANLRSAFTSVGLTESACQ